jgi:hypothetical protein
MADGSGGERREKREKKNIERGEVREKKERWRCHVGPVATWQPRQ